MKRRNGLLIGCVALVLMCAAVMFFVNVVVPRMGLAAPVSTATVRVSELTIAPTLELTSTPDVQSTKPPADLSTVEPTTGLGATRAWWDSNFEQSGDDLLGVVYTGGGKTYIVTFSDNRAQAIEIRFSKGDEAQNDELFATASGFMPSDVEFGETYQPDPITSPETFVVPAHSEWLSSVFTDEWWFGAEPGSLITIYHLVDGKASSIKLATGNNP